MIDRLLAAGLILGIIIIVVAATAYDPAVEVLPGRTMPQSQAERTLAVWDIPEAGREASDAHASSSASVAEPVMLRSH